MLSVAAGVGRRDKHGRGRCRLVRVVGPYGIEAVFRDGARRRADLEPCLIGEVFAPLRNPALIAHMAVDLTFGTVYWPTGADPVPDFLSYGEEGPTPGYDGETEAPPEDVVLP